MTILTQMSMIFRRFVLNDAKGDMLDDLLLEYDDSLRGGAYAVYSNDDSRPRNKFSGGEMNTTIGVSKFIKMLPITMRLQRSFDESIKLAGKPHDSEYVRDVSMAEQIKNIAKEIGAEAVGFTDVTPDVIFSGKDVPYKYAVVVAMRMSNEKIATAPSVDCMMEVSNTYGLLGVLVNKLSDRIIELGYDAVPGPALGGAVDYPSLARKAGLGEYGRHGLLISPFNGACQRIAAVFTNIELPVEEPNPYEWVRDFCAKCGKCIKACPSKAIREEPVSTKDGHYSCVIHEDCLSYFGKNYGCSVCIKECPFTEQGYDKIKKAFLPNNMK